jgi:hypothetical protein
MRFTYCTESGKGDLWRQSIGGITSQVKMAVAKTDRKSSNSGTS